MEMGEGGKGNKMEDGKTAENRSGH